MREQLLSGFRSSLPGLPALLLLLLLIPWQPRPAGAAGPAQSGTAGDAPERRITDYRVLRSPARDAAGKLRLAVRSFKADGVAHLLVVDPVSFQSLDLPASNFSFPDATAEAALGGTPLMRAIARYDAAPFPLQNGGATRAAAAVQGSFLTVDLCPSRRPFESELFQTLSAAGQGAPVPVAVAVTGVWLASHPQELAYLKRESAAGRLAITWMNHSYHHVYDPRAPLGSNFLLTPGTDFAGEVLELEQLLLSRGLVPSPFFRFPGLVSDAATVKRLREFSLIPIGSDAWLAKGETPRKGSFILVHGNGNEPKGIKLLLPMLRSGELHLLPLPEAFGN
jgi:hypothetical protein